MTTSFTTIISHKEQTSVSIGQHILEDLDKLLLPYHHTGYVVLADATTEKLFGQQVQESLGLLNVPVGIMTIEPGEKSKDVGFLLDILQDFGEYNLDRKSAIIALGGGVVGDIATVIAGLYYRGIDCIQIPTTLLSQVDSALGGKGAVNIDKHKNTLGIIRQPKHVVIDTALIQSLPQEQFRSGMGEVIKYALAMDAKLLDTLWKNDMHTQTTLLDVITKCVKLKMHVIAKDPLDTTGIRNVLNFGHTFGQAVELHTKLSHGEAISIGMAYAMQLSVLCNFLTKEDRDRALSVLTTYGLPVTIHGVSVKDMLKAMQKDKKSVAGDARFVLLKGLGHAVTDQRVPEELQKEAMKEILV